MTSSRRPIDWLHIERLWHRADWEFRHLRDLFEEYGWKTSRSSSGLIARTEQGDQFRIVTVDRYSHNLHGRHPNILTCSADWSYNATFNVYGEVKYLCERLQIERRVFGSISEAFHARGFPQLVSELLPAA